MIEDYQKRTNKPAAKKTVKVTFLKSPTGRPFNLAYNIGQTEKVEAKLAKSLIEAGIAEKA